MTVRGDTVPFLARPAARVLFLGAAHFALLVTLIVLLSLVLDIAHDGAAKLSADFLTGYPSRFPHKAGILPALVGSVWLILITGLVALPVGVGAAVYLEEYAPKNRFTRLIEINIANLAGVPSIIYGLLGLQLFVRYCGLGRSIVAGGLTLALLVLPVVIIASREALRTIPRTLREASLALGATKWQTIRSHVLPLAVPGIMTGCILAFSRAIGETAPLIMLGALTYVAFVPDGPLSPFTALPIQAFNWISRPQTAFHENAAGAILVLLAVLLVMNTSAIVLRARYQRRARF